MGKDYVGDIETDIESGLKPITEKARKELDKRAERMERRAKRNRNPEAFRRFKERNKDKYDFKS